MESITRVTKGNYVIDSYVDEGSLTYFEIHYCNSEQYIDALLIDDLWYEPNVNLDKVQNKESIYIVKPGLPLKTDFYLSDDQTFWLEFKSVHKTFRYATEEESVKIEGKIPRQSDREFQKRKRPLISVVTTVFNNARMLEQTIQSVINQDFESFEYIIKDALSTDNFNEIVSRYNKYNIKIISEKDSGIYDGMQAGILSANGEYVMILNSDDTYHSNKVLSEYAEHIESTNADAYYSNMMFYTPNTKFVRFGDATKAWFRSCINHSSLSIKKDKFIELGGFDLSMKICADRELTVKMLRNHLSLEKIEMISVNFRGTGASSAKHSSALLKDELKCCARYSYLNIAGYAYAIAKFTIDNVRYKKANKK